MTAAEMTVGPKLLVAPHRHNGHEAVYVIEGNLKYHIAGREQEVSAGAFLFFPRGTLEWCENTSDRHARVLEVHTPGGGIEEFIREVAEPAKSRTVPPPPSGPPDLAKLVAVAKKYGLEIQPPPSH